MNSVISQMLERYTLETKEDYYNALKEIVQEIALSALADTDFFEHVAFYGGTALRIFYGLNLNHLRERLIESGKWEKDRPLSMKNLQTLLINRIETVDFENAKLDVLGFVKNPKELDLWDKDFFLSVTNDYFMSYS